MAAVLNRFTPFMGFQPPNFYQGFSFNYPSPAVASSFFAPHRGPLCSQQAPPPLPPPQPQQTRVYSQQAPQQHPQAPLYSQQPPAPLYSQQPPAPTYSPPQQPPPTYAPPQQARPAYPQGQSAAQYPQAQSAAQYPQAQPAAQYPQAQSAAQYPQAQPAAQYPQAQSAAQYPQAQPAAQYPQAPAYPQAQRAPTYSRTEPGPSQSHQAPTYSQSPPRHQATSQTQRISRPSEQIPVPSSREQKHSTTVDYVDSGSNTFRRREPRVIREVIMLPTPEPIYRQVRHRMPTPERGVITRTVIKKANGEIVVKQQQPTRTKSHSRLSSTPPRHSARPRHIHTD